MNVLVLGGKHGFIGRHVVHALSAKGLHVLTSSRHAPRTGEPNNLRIRMERMKTAEHWRAAFQNRRIDVVVNAVGILRPRWFETYDAVHRRAVASLSHACAALGVHLVHVSAHGLKEKSLSAFNRSKWAGERAIEASGAIATIVRVPLLDGEGGYGARWFRRVAAWPVHFVPANARGLLAPMPVVTLAAQIADICAAGVFGRVGTIIRETGGPRAVTLAEHFASLRPAHLPPARLLRVPASLAWCAAAVCDVFHVTPYSVGHAELLTADNAPAALLVGRTAESCPFTAHSPQSVAPAFSATAQVR
jgi:uncharacterized protein YbjT (DUF2867 family)